MQILKIGKLGIQKRATDLAKDIYAHRIMPNILRDIVDKIVEYTPEDDGYDKRSWKKDNITAKSTSHYRVKIDSSKSGKTIFGNIEVMDIKDDINYVFLLAEGKEYNYPYMSEDGIDDTKRYERIDEEDVTYSEQATYNFIQRAIDEVLEKYGISSKTYLKENLD